MTSSWKYITNSSVPYVIHFIDAEPCCENAFSTNTCCPTTVAFYLELQKELNEVEEKVRNANYGCRGLCIEYEVLESFTFEPDEDLRAIEASIWPSVQTGMPTVLQSSLHSSHCVPCTNHSKAPFILPDYEAYGNLWGSPQLQPGITECQFTFL